MNMIKLFCYGTLQNPIIRKQVLNNSDHKITKDTISGFDIGIIKIDEEYFQILESGNSTIKGSVIEFTKKELKLIDEYETSFYNRKIIKTDNNTSVWVYCRHD